MHENENDHKISPGQYDGCKVDKDGNGGFQFLIANIDKGINRHLG